MKQILTSVAAVALFASTVNASATFKSGFKAGIGAGYKRYTAKMNKTYMPGSTSMLGFAGSPFNTNKSGHSNKAVGGVHFGYDNINDKLYTAFEVEYRYMPTKIEYQSSNYYTNTNSNGQTSLTQKHRHNIGLAGKLGILTKPDIAVYAIANVRYGKFTNHFIGPQNDIRFKNSKYSKKIFGLGGGLGVAYAMQRQASLAIDVTYDRYKKSKKTISFTNPGDTITFGTKKTNVLSAIIKLSKTF